MTGFEVLQGVVIVSSQVFGHLRSFKGWIQTEACLIPSYHGMLIFSVRKGLIFLMLCSANLQDRAVFAMCSLKVSWSSKITPRFLTEADGVIVDEPNWIMKSCCRVGVAGKTRSSVFARLSCRWCSFIHAEMSARQPEIRAATVGSSGRNER